MRGRQRTTISLEAIKFQTDKKLEKDILGQLTIMRNANIDQVDAFTQVVKNIQKSIFFHLKMPVEFKIIEDAPTDYTMAIVPPFFTEKHPLITGNRSNMVSEKQRLGMIKELIAAPGRVLDFGVDFQTGQLTGLAQQMPSTVYIGSSMLRDGNIKAEGIANTLIHELGHVNTLFLSLRYTTSTSWAIRYALEALDGTEDRNQFVATVQQIGAIVGESDLQRMKDLDERVQKEMITAIIMDKFAERTRSEIGTNLADKTGAEALADQFLVRFGNPLAYAQMMDYVLTQQRDAGAFRRTVGTVGFGVAATAAAFIMGPLLAAGSVMAAMAVDLWWLGDREAANPAYDKPYDRVKRMRNDLVAAAKQSDDANIRSQILLEIKALDSILPAMQKHETFYTKLAPLFSTSLRKLRREQRLVQDLEELFSNPLFLRHIQLSQINEIEG